MLLDLRDGWITPEQAVAAYGVILTASGELDEDATRARRAELAGGGGEPPETLDCEAQSQLIAERLAGYVRAPGTP